MKWEEVLKDIVSHTALTTGVEPKGTAKLDEKRIVEIIDNYISELKRNITPLHTHKYLTEAYFEYLKPDIKKLRKKNPEMTVLEAVKKVHTRGKLLKFAIKWMTVDRHKRLTRRGEDGLTN
tara:strand:- start:442 stop:804 length:363 start_codon:yes stop_codon:yes gene_type:complete